MSVRLSVAQKTKTYQIKQSKFDVVPKLPFKPIMYAPSNSDKTVLITNLIVSWRTKARPKVDALVFLLHLKIVMVAIIVSGEYYQTMIIYTISM